MSNELEQLRKKIDQVDKKLVSLLGRRFELTKKVGIYKKKMRLKPYDKKREKDMMAKRFEWGKKQKLDETFIKQLFKVIIQAVRDNHRKISGKKYGKK